MANIVAFHSQEHVERHHSLVCYYFVSFTYVNGHQIMGMAHHILLHDCRQC